MGYQNYDTVKTQGPIKLNVINARSFYSLKDGESINAPDYMLFSSGKHYWNMQVYQEWCGYNSVSRKYATLFFKELSKRGYLGTEPELGRYIALTNVFYYNKGRSEESEKALRIYLEKEIYNMEIPDLWVFSMMYTSFCGGSFEFITDILKKRLEKDMQPGFLGKRKKSFSAALPVLRHYLVLNGIQKAVPFNDPGISGNLGFYWNYIYENYHIPEALLEYAMAECFSGNNPFFNYSDDFPGNHPGVVITPKPQIPYGIINKFAFKGNPLALSAASDSKWKYASKKSLPDYSDIIGEYDKEAKSFGKNWFAVEKTKAEEKASSYLKNGGKYLFAAEKYAAALCEYALGNDNEAIDLMSEAAYAYSSDSGMYFLEDELDPAEAAMNWGKRKLAAKKGLPFENPKTYNEMEEKADICHEKRSEIKLRKLGFLYREKFKGLPAYPELWEKLREKAYKAGRYGIVLYCLDEGDELAERTFRKFSESLEDNDPFDYACCNLGLAYMDFLKGNYVLENLLRFVSIEFPKDEPLPEGETIDSLIEKCRNGDIPSIMFFAKEYSENKKAHINNKILKKMGKMFFYAAENIYRDIIVDYENANNIAEEFENGRIVSCPEHIAKTIEEWTNFERKHIKDQRLLRNAVLNGMCYMIPSVCSLLANDDIVEACGGFRAEQMVQPLYIAKEAGYDVKTALKAAESQRRSDSYEEYRKAHENDPDIFDPSDYKSEPNTDIDDLFDLAERLTNPGGYTNEELYLGGYRSAEQQLEDEMLREYAKDEFK